MKLKIKSVINQAIKRIECMDPRLLAIGIGGVLMLVSSKRRQRLAIRSAYIKGYLEALFRTAR